MSNPLHIVTGMDRNGVFRLLTLVGRAVADSFGPSCEVVIHDLRKPDRSIVDIFNGHVTGRKVGDGVPDHDLYELSSHYRDRDVLTGYVAHTADGRRLRSTTVFLRDSSGHPYASLGINLDLSLAERVHEQTSFLLATDGYQKTGPIAKRRVSHLLRDLTDEAKGLINKPVPGYDREDRIRVALHLEERGAFVIRGSVAAVARQLGVSRMAMYSYIEEARKQMNEGSPWEINESDGRRETETEPARPGELVKS